MFITCWSVKGGSGTTVTAACLAAIAARSLGRPTLLVDLAGDAAAALGVDESVGVGVSDWLTSVLAVTAGEPVRSDVPAGATTRWASTGPGLGDCEQRVDDVLSLLAWGDAPTARVDPAAGELLARVLEADGRLVIVDGGTLRPDSTSTITRSVIARSARSLLVSRPCYLTMRRATRCTTHVDGVVLLEESGRALGADDVASVVGAPIVARLRVEPQLARVVDAGLLSSRVPHGVERALGALVEV